MAAVVTARDDELWPPAQLAHWSGHRGMPPTGAANAHAVPYCSLGAVRNAASRPPAWRVGRRTRCRCWPRPTGPLLPRPRRSRGKQSASSGRAGEGALGTSVLRCCEHGIAAIAQPCSAPGARRNAGGAASIMTATKESCQLLGAIIYLQEQGQEPEAYARSSRARGDPATCIVSQLITEGFICQRWPRRRAVRSHTALSQRMGLRRCHALCAAEI